MPIYDFKCLSCGHAFDNLQKMTDPNPPCPHKPPTEKVFGLVGRDPVGEVATCGGVTKKLVSLSNFHLKGSGWYKTDYK